MNSIKDFIHIKPYSQRMYPAHGLEKNGIYYVHRKFLSGNELKLRDEIVNILINSIKNNVAPECLNGKLSSEILVHAFTDHNCHDTLTRGYNVITRVKDTSVIIGSCIVLDGALFSLDKPCEKVKNWLNQFDEFKN